MPNQRPWGPMAAELAYFHTVSKRRERERGERKMLMAPLLQVVLHLGGNTPLLSGITRTTFTWSSATAAADAAAFLRSLWNISCNK